MKAAFVVDTNVILVANQQHAGVSRSCIAACAEKLQQIKKTGCLVIDDGFRILHEYLNKTSPHQGKRAGDLFVKWALQNRSTPTNCIGVTLTESLDSASFAEFPSDEGLKEFDRSDRVFVAAARACAENPPILQATDSKWKLWQEALKRHGVTVHFICPDEIARFLTRKNA